MNKKKLKPVDGGENLKIILSNIKFPLFFFLLSLLLLILCSVIFFCCYHHARILFFLIFFSLVLSFLFGLNVGSGRDGEHNWKLLCGWQQQQKKRCKLWKGSCCPMCWDLLFWWFMFFFCLLKKGIFRVNWGRIRAL